MHFAVADGCNVYLLCAYNMQEILRGVIWTCEYMEKISANSVYMLTQRTHTIKAAWTVWIDKLPGFFFYPSTFSLKLSPLNESKISLIPMRAESSASVLVTPGLISTTNKPLSLSA